MNEKQENIEQIFQKEKEKEKISLKSFLIAAGAVGALTLILYLGQREAGKEPNPTPHTHHRNPIYYHRTRT